MKVTALLLSIIFTIAFLPSSYAGNRIGNGGAVWICKKKTFFKNEKIIWIKVLDIFEAETEFELPMNNFNGLNTTRIIDEVMWKLRQSKIFEMPLIEEIKLDVLSKMKPVKSEINEIDDIFYRIRPPASSCPDGEISREPIQIANYTSYGTLLLRADIWDSKHLDDINRAALIMHEIVYAYMRETYSDMDSVRARMIVGIVFSKLNQEQMNSKLSSVFSLSTNSSQ